MMKVPLLINYKPLYYNELIEGYHYIYIDEETNLTELESKYDLEAMAERAYEWYLENATPDGLAKTFKNMVLTRLGTV